MKSFFIFLIVLMQMNLPLFAQSNKRVSNSSSRQANVKGRIRTASSSSASVEKVKEKDPFTACMDNICKSDMYEEKGRCRCSYQLPRIEKVLRDIEKIQNQADEENKLVETMMNVGNTANIESAVGNVYKNINSIEKKSKVLASNKLDKDLLVMEGGPLYEVGLSKCEGNLLQFSVDDKQKKKDEYVILVEKDCGAYTTILKEKADGASNLLVQAQKNIELYDEQEYKKRNQLEVGACYTEYQSCAKMQCGPDFKNCKEAHKLSDAIKKCEAINFGKCEDNKTKVIVDLRKFVAKELEKQDMLYSCKSALGHLDKGRCMFKVLYVADKCSPSKKGCTSTDERFALPNQYFTCDDKRGSFKELVDGCEESCYLVGPNGEKIFKGTNHTNDSGRKAGQVVLAVVSLGISLVAEFPGCKNDSELDKFSTPPPPAGWGADGYPINPELRGVF